MTTVGPTVVRRQLGRRLRQLRDVSGMSVDQVVAERHLGISRAKLFKLEAGKHAVKPQDIAVLCARYGVSAKVTSTLQALALATQDASWWHVYGEDAVPEWFSLYVELEPAAATIRKYEAGCVPGLLQTTAALEMRSKEWSGTDCLNSLTWKLYMQGVEFNVPGIYFQSMRFSHPG